MTNRAAPSLAKWPFILGDLLLLLVAVWIVSRSPDPFSFWPLFFMFAAVAGGALLAIHPFLAEYRAAVRLAEASGLHEAAAKINQVESIAQKIGEATGQWQDIHNLAAQTTNAARGITEQMASEAKAFAEFMQQTNDSEKAHLRLEVEKMKRAESEWVQTLVMLMDHVYGIYAAAVRSGKQSLINQLTQYQRACRDVARRIGLVPIEVNAGEPYSEEAHQLADPDTQLPENPVVELTLATGYTYQGRLIRKPLVNLRQPGNPSSDAVGPASSQPGELFQLDTTLPEGAAPPPAKTLLTETEEPRDAEDEKDDRPRAADNTI